MPERFPPLKIQCERGYNAFRVGRIANPYKIDTYFYKEWERGFNKAYFENLQRRSKRSAKHIYP